jgi:hypothetical protein
MAGISEGEEKVVLMKSKIKIGFVGAVHPNMPGDDVGLYKTIIDRMENLKGEFGYDTAVVHSVIRSEADAEKARAFLDDQQVDFTMIICPSLPFGRIALPLSKLNSLLGIWSFPEPVKNGALQLNSFCGLNMIGSILANYFNEYNIPYKWFYDFPDSPMFRERFTVTLGAIRAIIFIEIMRKNDHN